MAFKDFFIKTDSKKVEQRAVNVNNDNTFTYTLTSGGLTLFSEHTNGALALSAIYAATELISNSIAELPINIKRRSTKKEAPKHSLYFAFENCLISKFMLIKQMVSDMLLYGNGFAKINRATDGTIVGFRYLPAQSVTINYNESKQTITYLCHTVGTVNDADMIHLYKNSRDGVIGEGIVKQAHRTIELCQNTENAASDYFSKGLHQFGVLHSKVPLQGKQAADAVNYVNGKVNTGSDAANYIKFIPFDMEFQSLSQDADKAQMIETRQYNITEIARYFNISPVLLADLSHSSYSTLEAVQLDFLTHTLQPYISMIESEFNRKLLSLSETNLYIDLDETYLLKSDKQSTASYLQTLTNAGIMSINEARQVLNLQPVEGGDKHVIAYTKIDDNTINEQADK